MRISKSSVLLAAIIATTAFVRCSPVKSSMSKFGADAGVVGLAASGSSSKPSVTAKVKTSTTESYLSPDQKSMVQSFNELGEFEVKDFPSEFNSDSSLVTLVVDANSPVTSVSLRVESREGKQFLVLPVESTPEALNLKGKVVNVRLNY